MPRFVVQQHDASSLHYDFRLEVDGVGVSWAVPKGPSLDPAVKRLAIPVEDHSLDYFDYEGVIDEGSYGAGPVIVWDEGTYENLSDEPMASGLEAGRIKFRLNGHKLRGGWSLRKLPDGRVKGWLLVKMSDDEADRERDLVGAEPRSVKTGRTIDEVT